MDKSFPVVGVPTCRQTIGDLDYDCTQHKYIAALYDSADVLPVQIPLLAERFAVDEILQRLDGLLLTGSHSNVHPRHYQDHYDETDFKLDEFRDKTVLRLIKPAIERGLPLFAICRGFQELNVAYGGKLYSRVHEQDGFDDHREDKDKALEERYAEVHEVKVPGEGQLRAILNSESVMVNSLHEQGIREVGEGLVIEARANDGLVEAISVEASPGFAIGVQWHPEWNSTQNPVSTALFTAFGKACRDYKQTKSIHV